MQLPDVELGKILSIYLLDASFEDLLIDDSLPYPERVLKYTHSDHSLQRVKHVKLITYAIENLPFSKIEVLLDEVLPSVCKDKETLIRLTLTQELREIIKIVSAHNKEGMDYIENKILPILKDLLRDDEISIREEASNTFCYCASVLPCSETSTHILPIIMELAHDPEGEEMRSQITAAPLLNKISNYLGPNYTIEFLVPALICLSENSHFQVRKAAAYSYNEVCNITFPDIVLYKLLPSFRRLCQDEVWSVRKACCDSLIKLCKVIPVDLRLYYLCDIAIEFSKDVSKWVKSSYYKNLGEFISNLPGNKTPNTLLEHYYSFSKPNPMFVNDIIISCAESFVNVLNTLTKSKWNELKPVLQFLVRNPNVLIGKLISPEYSLELNSYLELFLNDSIDVKQEVVKHIASYIYYLPVENRTPKSIISTPSLNWRFRQCIASQFKEFISYLPFQTITEVFLPLCLTLLSDIVANVRTAIITSIGDLIMILNDKEKNNGNETPLNDFIKELVKFASANTYLKRQTYIEICNSIIPVIDSNLFNKYFMSSLIELSDDKITLVRLTLSILISKNNNIEWFRSNPEIIKIISKYENDECEDIRNIIPNNIPPIPQLIATNSAYLPTPKSNESMTSLISASDILSPPATTPSSTFQVDPSFQGIINQMKEKLNSIASITDKDWNEKLNRSLYYNLYPMIPEAPRPKVMFLFENSIKIIHPYICDSVVNGIIGGLSRYITIELTKEILMKFLQLLNDMIVQLNS